MSDSIQPLIISILITLLPFLVSIFGIWLQYTRQNKILRPEVDKTDADAKSAHAESAKISAEVAQMYATQVKDLKAQLDKLEEDFSEERLRCEHQTQTFLSEFRKLREEIDSYKDYIERLIYQIKSYGKEPVPFKEEKKDDGKM